MNKWISYDDGTCQYIREHSDKWEMIMLIWLDTTYEDRANGYKEYVVAHGYLNKADITQDDIEMAQELLWFYVSPLSDFDVAVCVLEDRLQRDEYVIFETDSKDDAKKFIKRFIKEN